MDGPDSGTAAGPGPGGPQGNDRGALCDRVLASPKLWRQVLAQSLPPTTIGGLASPHEVSEKRHFLRRGRPAAARPRLRSHPDTACTGSGTAFGAAAAKRRCTLPAAWYAQQGEPWTILTGLPPDEVGVSWYALRFWIELGFRACPRPRPGAVKSLGWQWQKTRVQGPPRALDCQHRRPRGLARFPTVTQRPPPHGTGLAACRVDPLTQRLEGPGTSRTGAEGMPGRTHFRPGPSHGAAVTGSQGPALAFFSVWPTSRA